MEIVVDVNKVFDQEFIYDQYTNGNYAMPYKTLQIFATIRGSPVVNRHGDGSTGLVENSAVTTSAPEVGFTIVKKISGSFLEANASAKLDYVMPSFRTLSGTATQKEIDAVDDQHTVTYA